MQLLSSTGRIVDDTRVTKFIDNLVEVAEKEKDRSTFSFLQWFVSEQLREEILEFLILF
jgi:ferritin